MRREISFIPFGLVIQVDRLRIREFFLDPLHGIAVRHPLYAETPVPPGVQQARHGRVAH
jgi:hypothetical protein